MNWFPRSAGEPQASSQDEPSQDERLAQLLSELADRVQRGESVELERVCESHPDLANELRFLWGAVVVSAAAGSGARLEADRQAPPDDPRQPRAPDGGAYLRGDAERESEGSFIGALPCRLGDYESLAELGRGEIGRAHV